MKDEKIFEGGQDLAGRGVYREKMLPFAANGLIFTDGPSQESDRSPVCICSWKKSQRAAERARLFSMRRLQSFQAHTELHLFTTGTIALRSHVDPGINY